MIEQARHYCFDCLILKEDYVIVDFDVYRAFLADFIDRIKARHSIDILFVLRDRFDDVIEVFDVR